MSIDGAFHVGYTAIRYFSVFLLNIIFYLAFAENAFLLKLGTDYLLLF